jgi:hypothetical protein
MVFKDLKSQIHHTPKKKQFHGHKTDPASRHRRHPIITINLRVRSNEREMVIGSRRGSRSRELSHCSCKQTCR